MNFIYILFSISTLYSLSLNVPNDYSTINEAISFANSGDSIIVAPGVYRETINFNGKDITIISEEGLTNTIIDASSNEGGNAKDGELYISSDENYNMNSISSYLIGENFSGSNIINVDNANQFDVNDEVLILVSEHNADQSSNQTGKYETRYIISIIDNSIYLDFPIVNSYNDSFFTQIIKIPNFSNLTIDGSVYSNSYSSFNNGGVVAFRVRDSFINNGTINMSGAGYRGGQGGYCNNSGQRGYGVRGYQCGISGGPGGQGCHGSGSSGSNPSLSSESQNPLIMGGGGGGGYGGQNSMWNPPPCYYGGSGGNGGGIIFITATNFTNSGSIISNGSGGGSQTNYCTGPGGSGAGGTISVSSSNFIQQGSISASRVHTINLESNSNLITDNTALIFNNGETYTSELSGFTLRGKYVIDINNSSPTISNCKIEIPEFIPEDSRENEIKGLAIKVLGGEPTFINISVTNHNFSVYHTSLISGAYIYLEGSSPSFYDSNFNNLTMNLYYDNGNPSIIDGGIIYQSAGSSYFENCNFSFNSIDALNLGHIVQGGILNLNQANINLHDCIINNNIINLNGNDSFLRGGLIYANNEGTIELTSSNIDENWLNASNITGGTVHLNSSNLSIISNSNQILNNAGGEALFFFDQGGAIDMSSDYIYNNSTNIIYSNTNHFLNLMSNDISVEFNSGYFLQANGNITIISSYISENGEDVLIGSGELSIDSSIIWNNNGTAVNFNGLKNISGLTYLTTNSGYGIDGSGDIYLDFVHIEENSLGGINASGNISASGTDFNDNGGAGIQLSGESFSINLTDFCRINGNSSGGIVTTNGGTVKVVDSEIKYNMGVGINGFTDTLSVVNTIVSNNLGGLYGYAIAMIENSRIDSNISVIKSGGIELSSGKLIINNSQFNNNSGTNGGAINAIDVSISNSEIKNNYASLAGGGIYVHGELIISDSTLISNNTANNHGGGIIIHSTSQILNSFVNENNALNGGGLSGEGNLYIENSHFIGNTASQIGGGIYYSSGELQIGNSKISNNIANEGGGGFIESINPLIQFSEISNNQSNNIGGGLLFSSGEDPSSPTINNCTIVDNTSEVQGSGVLSKNSTNPLIQNSILWDNISPDAVQIYLQDNSELNISYCNIEGGLAGIIGFQNIYYTNNINMDPSFINSNNTNYYLDYNSPCIDAGNPASTYDPDNTISDMGAYFFDQETYVVGCMSEDAQNYNENANIDFGCIFGPNIISIYDAPEDQGGSVFINWEANSLDILPHQTISHYSIFRYLPSQRGWELLDMIPSNYFTEYGYVAPTIQTSIPSDSLFYHTDYLIRAHTNDMIVFYDSDVVSGYSIDNIAPSVPSNMNATELGGQIQLTWHYDLEDDFSYHMLQSINNNQLVTIDTLINLNIEEYYDEYTVNSVDIHNNHSNPSTETLSMYNLHFGANLISFSVINEDSSVDNMLSQCDITDIIGEGQAASNTENGWVGNLDNLSVNRGYWVKADSEHICPVVGMNLIESEYDLHFGANLISYACDEVGLLEELVECNGDINSIIGEGEAASCVEGNWIGNLSTLNPGRGYWFKSTTSFDLAFECPEQSANSREVFVQQPREYNQSTQQAFYMFKDIEGIAQGDEVRAYNNGILVGSQIYLGQEYLTLPTMGDDFQIETDGYLSLSQTPIFKLIKQSGEELILQGNIPGWENNEIFIVEEALRMKVLPDAYELVNAYPNPFNPTTTINFSVPDIAKVTIEIYNIQGSRIATLTNKEYTSGYHSIVWNANKLASGVYFIRFNANGLADSKKIMLLK